MTACPSDPVLVVVLGRGDDAMMHVSPECEPVVYDDTDPEDILSTATGVWWTSLSLPDRPYRQLFAPDSRYVEGKQLLTSIQDATSIPLTLAVQGSSVADTKALMDAVDAATAAYPATMRVLADGDALYTWPVAAPALSSWGQVTPQRSGLFVAEAAVIMMVNPEVAST